MNIWTRKSIELANQKNYLDLLYRVYPISENVRREISDSTKNDISNFFNGRNNIELLKILIDQTNKKQIVFPIKDSYVAFLKHDNSAIDRNPNTVDRITSILYEMGYDELINKATSPKETNRQIGPLFGNWINKGSLGVNRVDDELGEQLKDIVVGKPETLKEQLKPILANECLFFTDLYKAGVGEKIEDMFREMIAGPGAVKATIHKYVR